MGAVDTFQDVCHLAVDGGLLASTGGIPSLPGARPVSGEILDLSITSYADDVAKGTLFSDGQELQQLVLAEDMALSDSLQRICTAQHAGKQ